MAPGGSTHQDIVGSRVTYADYGVAPSNVELRSFSTGKSAAAGGRFGIASDSAVLDLLGCPVCMYLIDPPIHQVILNILYFNLTSWKVLEFSCCLE